MVEIENTKTKVQNKDIFDLIDKKHMHKSSYNTLSKMAYILGIILCPCHLPLTLSLLSLLFSGFSINFFQIGNISLIILLFSTGFVIALLFGYYLKQKSKKFC